MPSLFRGLLKAILSLRYNFVKGLPALRQKSFLGLKQLHERSCSPEYPSYKRDILGQNVSDLHCVNMEMLEDGIFKAAHGLTTIEEVFRVVSE